MLGLSVIRSGQEYVLDSIEIAAIRRNLLVALLVALDITRDQAENRADLVLSFYRLGTDAEQDAELARFTHGVNIPPADGRTNVRRTMVETALGRIVSMGSNVYPGIETDIGKILRRIATDEDPKDANGDLTGLAARIDGWPGDGSLFLQTYAHLESS
ncbi:hypothetical protein EBS80_03835 [bacterium]|nr:hypothetical protein [bacterium]